MKPFSIIGAGVGGLIGAVIWAAISYFTQHEIGYVAWAVGGLVGFLSLLAGGSGTSNGVFCAIIAVVSIFGGKYMATSFVVGNAIQANQQDLYREYLKDAKDFSKLKSEKEYPDFMVRHRYTKQKKAAAIPEEELENFKEATAPMLEKMAETSPTFEEWASSDEAKAAQANVRAKIDVTGIVVKDMNAIDLIFGFLGIATAFRVGSGSRQKAQPTPAA